MRRLRPVDLFLHPTEVHVVTAADGSRWATDRYIVVRLDHPVSTVLDGLAGLDDGVWEIRALRPPARRGDTTIPLERVFDGWECVQTVYPSRWVLLDGHSEQIQRRPLVTSPHGDEVAAVVDGHLWRALTRANPYPAEVWAEYRQSGQHAGAGVVRVMVAPPEGGPYVLAYLMTVAMGCTVTLPTVPEGVLG